MNWQRARQPDQKAARVAAILQAAGTLFDEKELSSISMGELAKRAGLGKASLYHYFRTKEEVFISLYGAEFDAWLPDIERKLQRLAAATPVGSPTPACIASALTAAIRGRTRFCRLTVVFSSVLERNLSQDFLREFTQSLLAPQARFIAAMQGVQPDISGHAVEEFLFQHHAIIAGLWPLGHPSSEVVEVLQDEAFRGFRVDFYPLFESTIRQLIQGRQSG